MAAEWKCCQDVPGRLLRGGCARFAAVRSPTMPDTVNRELRLRRRPVGRIAPDDFELVRAPVPTASPGEAVVRNLYLSLVRRTASGWKTSSSTCRPSSWAT